MVTMRRIQALVLLLPLALPAVAQEWRWATLPGSEFRPMQERGNQGYNPWSRLGDQTSGTPEVTPRFVERPKRQYQATTQPSFPAPQYYRHLPQAHAGHWSVPPSGLLPGTGHHGLAYPGLAYPDGLYPGVTYGGLGYPGLGYPGLGYPGLGHSGLGYPGGFPGLGIMPWGWVPW